MVFKIINNTDAAFIELTNGNIDYHSLRPLEFKEKSWSDEFNNRFLKGVQYSGGYTYIGWNNDHPIFKDKRVRQAMTHLTDRQSMVENLLFGLAETVEGPISKFRPEYNHDLRPYGYDYERALDLLDEAGWVDVDDDGSNVDPGHRREPTGKEHDGDLLPHGLRGGAVVVRLDEVEPREYPGDRGGSHVRRHVPRLRVVELLA